MSAAIVWFRQDLRMEDNPALDAARRHGGPVIPVYIWAPDEEGDWPPGAASKYWLHQSLASLGTSLGKAGSRLLLRQGDSFKQLQQLVRETGASGVFWNRRYEPAILQRDTRIKDRLRKEDLTVESFNASLLHEPKDIQTGGGTPYKVFTPFSKTLLDQVAPRAPLPAPSSLQAPKRWPRSDALDDLELQPKVDWAGGIRQAWEPGTSGARANLKRFLREAYDDYNQNRNRPDYQGTSRLSPHLHFGEISPHQVWAALERDGRRTSGGRPSQFLLELVWREFSHHLLYHFPHTPNQPLRQEFAKFPWRKKKSGLKAWQKGRTGYPIVDAGMRELWTTGWMHNRVRMIAGSFLVKDLLISWTEGARWFWDTLVDADLASNTLGWQWTAGCGADAAPYFRVFNPVSQGEKFDPNGDYVRRWIPELKDVPARCIHKPWEAERDLLEKRGRNEDNPYREPIVRHSIAREVALEAYEKMKQ